MSLHHFFLEDQVLALESGPCFALRLSPDDAKHARVLRLEPGERLSVVDAAQDYFECEVVSAEGDIVVRISRSSIRPIADRPSFWLKASPKATRWMTSCVMPPRSG